MSRIRFFIFPEGRIRSISSRIRNPDHMVATDMLSVGGDCQADRNSERVEAAAGH